MVATEKSHKFEKGNTYGRETSRKGVPNKTTRILKDALLLAAEQVGDISGIAREDLSEEGIEHGKDGLVGYLRWAAKCEPKAFLHILGKLIPVQMKVDSVTQTVYQSVEELQHDVAARGLNLRAFGQLLLEAHQAKSGELVTNGNADARAPTDGESEPVVENGQQSG